MALLLGASLIMAAAACTAEISSTDRSAPAAQKTKAAREYEIMRTEAEWRKTLSREQFKILRDKGTERAFSGKYWKTKAAGTYVCAGCGQPLFHSDHKFDSGTGWPSFSRPAQGSAVATESDVTFGMVRTEILCNRCGGHLGHVFEDGPAPTGLRYCVNSASIDLVATK